MDDSARLDYWQWLCVALRNVLAARHRVERTPDGRHLRITLARTAPFLRNTVTLLLDLHAIACTLPDGRDLTLSFRRENSVLGLSDGLPESSVMGPAEAAEYLVSRIARAVEENRGSGLFLRK